MTTDITLALSAAAIALSPGFAHALAPQDFQCTMTGSSSSSSATINLSLKNVSSMPVTVSGSFLDPDADAFFVLSETGQRPFVESLQCTSQSPSSLAPGQVLNVSYPLSTRYQLTPSKPNFIGVQQGIFVTTSATADTVAVDCGGVTLNGPTIGTTTQPLTDATVNDCDGNRSATWRNAQRLAKYITQPRIRNLREPWLLDRYLVPFTWNSSAAAEATAIWDSRMADIYNALAGDDIGVKCIEGQSLAKCSEPGTRATAGVGNIALCDAYFDDLDDLGRAATLVHEITHVVHGTNDDANGEATIGSVTDANGPFDDFGEVANMVNSGRAETCKELSDGGRAACRAAATLLFFPLLPLCEREYDCESLPEGAAAVWEAIVASQIWVHFNALYVSHGFGNVTSAALQNEISRVHAGESPIDDFPAVDATVQASRNPPAINVAGYRPMFDKFRAYAVANGREQLSSIVSISHNTDPLSGGRSPLEDYVRFVETGQRADVYAQKFFTSVFAAKFLPLTL